MAYRKEVTELAKLTGKARPSIRYMIKQLGRLPTVEEILKQRAGRPAYKENGLSVKDIARLTNRTISVIYKLKRKLGRLPTLEEVVNRENGRPKKGE